MADNDIIDFYKKADNNQVPDEPLKEQVETPEPVVSEAVAVPVDNLLGTAVLTPQTTWNYPITASDVNSMGGRLRNALNTNSANSLINSFNP